MIRTGRNMSIMDFYNRKKASGMKPKAALIASMNKTLRIIHSLCKNGCLFI